MRHILLLALFTTILAGCAKVSVRKVADPDGPDGLRYYMPRPYVMVYEPFVVGSRVYVVEGEMSQDGQYVLITEASDDLGGILKSSLRGNAVPAGKVLSSLAEGADGSDGEAQAGEEASSGTATPLIETPKPPPAGGMLSIKMTNDNNAYAVTPLKRYMDIVWLPDFDEQYVVSGRAGLGNAAISMSMGQGWNLQGLDANADNSALAEPLIAFYKDSVGALSKVVQTKLGVLPVTMGEGEAQAGEEALQPATFAGGTPLSVKVTVARMAAPGLYPILKPRELCGKTICSGTDLAVYGHVEHRILVPVPPMTNIAFNTYDVVVIEAATVSGDSPLRLHQYPTGNTPDNPSGFAAAITPVDPAATLKALETRIGQQLGGDPNARWTVTLALKAGALKAVTAVLVRTGTPEMSEQRAKQIITRIVQQNGFSIAADDVSVQAP